MKPANTPLTIGVRAAVGAVVVAVAASAVVLVGSLELPTASREPVALVADTTQNAARTLVCDGGFAELGADPGNPDLAVPTGAPEVVFAGAKSEKRELSRALGGVGLPQVTSAPGSELLAAAQLQNVTTETLKGSVGSTCAEPLNEQWLIGGSTDLGVTTTLNVGNPGSVPATVQISVFDEEGAVDSVQTAGIIVGPGAQHTVSLNGYAPDRARLAVQVTSTGAPVTAALSVGQSVGLQPFGVSVVDRQAEPNTKLVIPGVTNAPGHDHGPSDAGEGDPYPVMVRALAPGGETTVATVRALDSRGHATELGTIELPAHTVGELLVTTWPEDAAAIEVSSEAPVIAAALGSAETETEHDYEWFTPAPAIAAGEPVVVPVVKGGRVVLVHPGEGEAEVVVTTAKGKSQTTKLLPGSARTVTVAHNSTITATDEVFVGVRHVDGASIASYPLLPNSQRDGALTVYTR